MTSAALNRAGSGIHAGGAVIGSAEPRGGSPNGTLYIAWDDNFSASLWPLDQDFNLGDLIGTQTIIEGGNRNRIFGEEIAGGEDLDADGKAELFVGDFLADGSRFGNRPGSGIGYVFYDAALLKGLEFDLDSVPLHLSLTEILGPSANSIGSDTAVMGDFDGDGIGDLVFGSPHHSPYGRVSAGSVHLIFGRVGGWSLQVDTAPSLFPVSDEVRIAEISGARGGEGIDSGDTICYSSAVGDVDEDGIEDLIINEMEGNGLATGSIDVGNLIILSGARISAQTVLHFAQFGGGDGFSSALVLTNPSDVAAATGSVRFTDDQGLPLTFVFSSNLGVRLPSTVSSGDPLEFSVPAMGSITLTTVGAGPLQVGSAVVSSNSPLGGMVRFQIPGIGIAGVSPSLPLEGFIVPVRHTSMGVETGLAFRNISAHPISLDLVLHSSMGEVVSEVVRVELPTQGHLARFLSQLFPDRVSAEFKGTISVRARGGLVAAIALELSIAKREFTALPVVPLP